MTIGVVGRGRMGNALCAALQRKGVEVVSIGRSDRPDARSFDCVILAVPDRAIAETATQFTDAQRLGHVSGATTLEPLHHAHAFSMHPLTTISGSHSDENAFDGVWAAIDGASQSDIDFATDLATTLGMTAVRVAPEHRVAYHAAASIASNFLITIEDVAEELLASTDVPREALVPLVQATVANWAQQGARPALTGPVVREDTVTVQAQREAVGTVAPMHLALFDELVAATERLSKKPVA